jgi:CheY-like chemotaxis protein
MRALLKRMLVTRGARHATEAVDGHNAMEMLASQEFDLVLLDLDMQPMNGLEFTRLVRQGFANNRVPIIMISGHTGLDDVRTARDAGVNEFLVKPVTPKNLFGRIAEVFERPRPFVSCPAYVGPERRRRQPGGANPKRRQDDKAKQVIELE